MRPTKKAALIILDGWGIGAGDASDAIKAADTPFFDRLMATAPHATLRTDGEEVGLPTGQMGNSEVGHLNIGAGRVVYQDLVRIDHALKDGSLASSPILACAFAAARQPGRRLHFMGLIGDGGVHAMQRHLVGLCTMARKAGVEESFIHAFMDGRDTDPRSGAGFMRALMEDLRGTGARVASLCGRYYAMDRDKRWERVRKAYDLLVRGTGVQAADPLEAIERSYAAGITDEFIEPCTIIGPDSEPPVSIRPHDVVICFNFRTDRCREITQALTQQAFPEQGMEPLPLHYITMTQYDHTYKDVDVLFHKDDLRHTLGEVVSAAGASQVRIAETEKYPHVTFFFNGGREEPFPGERRIMVPSPKVATYDLQPEMSAEAITEAIVHEITTDPPDLICLNFANPDMVGHTGVFQAIVEAVGTTDRCAARVVQAARAAGYACVIIADHGNADKALNADGSPNTAHTTNPVPVIILSEGITGVRHGRLADVAPTLLDLMGMEKPVEMTGSSLLVRS